ncbi:MAG: HNH endonuclease [Bacteroidales bacterium]|nr:HNH endonuclease [Bacteroidales bacterium]
MRCSANGLVTPGEIVDHKVPKNACIDPWDKSNWQTLCRKCHAIKSAKDKKYFRNDENK